MALIRLSLRDFVIVESLELELEPGFSVLSGETGAGKSILIDALQLVLGQRAESDVVRQGNKRCEISAEFDHPRSLDIWLDEQGFPTEATLILKRQIDAEGRSRGWINGSVATMTQLKAVADHLIDIHGQHAWHSLTRPQAQLDLLDGYAQIELSALRAAWDAWRQAQSNLQNAKQASQKGQERREQLLWQIAEVEQLKPMPDEWGSLNEEHTRLAHRQDLLETAQSVTQDLDEEPVDVNRVLASAANRLTHMAAFEPQFTQWSQTLLQASDLVSDVLHEVKAYARHGDLGPDRFQQLDDRVSLWMQLSKRFRTTPDQLAAVYSDWQSELAALDASADMEALEAKARAAQKAWKSIADEVSHARLKASRSLAREVTSIMQTLGMQGGNLSIDVRPAEPNHHGQDLVEFLVAGHAGVTPKPVAKVASGGELSRIALAVAVCTSRLGAAGTLIFDEVDAGIGGKVAHTVGQLMRQLGEDRQVLAITHLAPVAATAHHHFKVEKRTIEGATSSQISTLSNSDRVIEIARMLGGDADSPTVMAHAREMLAA